MTTLSTSAAGVGGSALPVPEATVPVKGEGRPTAWWGMVCLIMTESTIFAGLIGSYFFYRAASKQWPPPGIELPKLTLTIKIGRASCRERV